MRISVKRSANITLNPSPRIAHSLLPVPVTLSLTIKGGKRAFQIILNSASPYLVNYVITSTTIFPGTTFRRNNAGVTYTLLPSLFHPSPPSLMRDSRRSDDDDDDGNEFCGIYNGDPDACDVARAFHRFPS